MQEREQRGFVSEAEAAPATAYATTADPSAKVPCRAPPAPVRREWNGWAFLAPDAQPEVDADGYIYADGRKLNKRHAAQLVYAYDVLRNRFLEREDASVEFEMFVHFEEGNRSAFLAPDVMVAFGSRRVEDLSSHRVWERGLPTLVLEVLSKSTREEDLDRKRVIYQNEGVAEYVMYDPWGRWLPGRLLLCRLSGGVYVEERPRPVALVSADGSTAAPVVRSEALGLEFFDQDGHLRLRDAATGEILLDYDQTRAEKDLAQAMAREERTGRQEERARAEAAETRAAAEAEKRQEERARAEAAEARAGEERARAEAAETRAEAEAEQRQEQRARAEAAETRAEAEAKKRQEERVRAEAAEAEAEKREEERAREAEERERAQERVAELERLLREISPGGPSGPGEGAPSA